MEGQGLLRKPVRNSLVRLVWAEIRHQKGGADVGGVRREKAWGGGGEVGSAGAPGVVLDGSP